VPESKVVDHFVVNSLDSISLIADVSCQSSQIETAATPINEDKSKSKFQSEDSLSIVHDKKGHDVTDVPKPLSCQNLEVVKNEESIDVVEESRLGVENKFSRQWLEDLLTPIEFPSPHLMKLLLINIVMITTIASRNFIILRA